MYLSEWEIEDAIAWTPSIIEIPPYTGLRLKDRQRYLKTIGGYIDLLFEWQNKYVIAELKAIPIEDKTTVTDQVLTYRKALARESNIDEEKIVCILASPLGFSQDVLDICQKTGVLTKSLDQTSLIQSAPRHRDSLLPGFFSDSEEESRLIDLLQRRRIEINTSEINDHTVSAVKSAKTWLSQRVHDDFGKRTLAALFKQVSSMAPLMAHEISAPSDGSLRSNEDKWFWLFYSVLDRRANASTFINARNALDRNGVFNPRHIYDLAERGEKQAKERIAEILENAGFALLVDNGQGRLAYPKSIIDAARFIKRYDYDFEKIYNEHMTRNHNDREATFNSLWKELTGIYGVGPRIAAQFIRGMTLKGSWDLPLKDNRLLEKTPLNCRFAGSARFGVVESESTYERELAKFADQYLEGNRAILSHVLWYIRKRFCNKVPICSECPMTGYCTLFLKLSNSGSLDFKPRLKSAKTDDVGSQATLITYSSP
jgi:hypothetical protein